MELITPSHDDKPSQTWDDGTKAWYRNGVLHRENFPAVEYANGNRSWYHNGKLHRVGGPAVELIDDDDRYFVYGKRLTQEEYRSWYFNHIYKSSRAY